MKNNWQIKKLNEICDKGSSNISQNQLTKEEGIYPIYGAGGLIKDISFFQQDKDYISIIKDGAGIGRVSLLPAKSSVIGTLQYIIPKYNINLKFLYYIMNSFDFSKYKNGATIPHIYFREYSNEQFVIPPLPEQKRIVKVLDDVFSKVEIAKNNAEKNLQNSKALFESCLQSIFAKKGKDWENKLLGEIATFRNGMNFTKKSKGETIKIVGVRDFQKSFWVPFENLETVIIDGELNEIDLLKKDDILAVRSNGNPELIGRTLLSGDLKEKVSHSGFTIRIRLNLKNIYSPYLCHYLKSQKVRKELIKSGTGINIKSLNQVALSSLLVSFPKSLVEQKSIVKKLDALSEQTKKLEVIYKQKLADLEELKKSLLKKAFSGEL